MRIPSYLAGVYGSKAGLVNVRVAIEAHMELSVKQGADLVYDTNVIHVDHEKGIVTC